MSKISKAAFKSLVKECLVEILAEGIDSTEERLSEARERSSSAPLSRPSRTRRKQRRVDPLDEVAAPVTEKFERAVDRSVGALTSDPIMQSIFADTARTTLQEQISNESPGANQMGVLGQGAPPSNVSNDFIAQAGDKWAQLAFADPKKK